MFFIEKPGEDQYNYFRVGDDRMGKPDYLQIKEVQAYKTYLEVEKNYTEATINDYLEDLKNYFAYLNGEGLKSTEIEYNDARNYIAYLGFKKKNSPSTVARSISTLRSFYRFLMKEEKATTNVFTLLKMPKKANHLPRFFYYNELEELFQVPDLTIPLGQRDALILEILYGTGIRVSELVAIKIPDIDLTRREIRIMGKGQKMRIVYFEPIVQKRLKLYLHDGREKLLSNNKHEYLLVNHLGNPLTTRGVRDILTRMIEKTALQKKISPHMLRHSFATSLLNEGCDILSVQQLLGHESITATGIYTHVTSDRLKEVYYKTHPRARK